MTYDFPVYAPAYLVNFVLTAVVGVLAYRRRAAPGALAFAGLMASASIWSFAQFFESGAITVAGRTFWSQVQYIGAVSLGPLWLLFAARYAGVRFAEGRRAAWLFIIPAITLVLVWTNGLHHLIWTHITLTSHPAPVAIYAHGVWFWIHSVFSYVAVITGAILLLREAAFSPRFRQYQTLALVTGAIAPLVANLIYVFKVSPWPGLDLTSFAFTISGLLYLPALVNLRMLDLTPVARGSVIEQMTDAMIVTDAQLRVADVNPAVGELFGVDTAPWIGLPLPVVLAHIPDLATLASGLQPAQAMIALPHSGQTRFIDARKSVLSDRRQRPIGLLFLLHDVTQLKQAEQHAFDLALEQERVRLLSRFIRDASHEFRTPLAVINTSLYLLIRSPEPVARETHREQIAAQVARIDQLLNEMLTMSRLDERDPLVLNDLDINDLVGKVAAANPGQPGKQPPVMVETAPQLPSVRGDELQLLRALGHLLQNALDHTQPSGVIRITTQARGGLVVITISDTGEGMDAALQRRIFERFFRSDDAHSTPGFGLGLPMTRAIIEAHGGTIEVASTPGAGTIFTVQLPGRDASVLSGEPALLPTGPLRAPRVTLEPLQDAP